MAKTSKNTGKKDENGILGNPSEKNLQMELFAVMLYRKPKTRGDHRSIYYGGLIQGRYMDDDRGYPSTTVAATTDGIRFTA